MRRQSFITFGIVLVAVSGALAKKEPAIPTTATNAETGRARSGECNRTGI